MAGIGFELYKILHEGTLSSIIKAFFFGVIIVAGPWILSILCIYFIQKFAHTAISENPVLFTVTIVNIYAYSLIIFGGIHYVFSRYIADMIYLENRENIPSALITIFLLTIILSASLGFIFVAFNDFSAVRSGSLYAVSLIMLFVLVNLIWIMLIYVALLKEYNKIFITYLAGIILSILGVFHLGSTHGVAGAILGYSAGQVLIIVALLLIAQKSYPVKTLKLNWEIFGYFPQFIYLFLTGFFFNMAVWSDKIIYWFTRGINIPGTLYYYYNEYDLPVFLSYMTMIPGLVYFLVISETIFHRDYINFIKNIGQDRLVTILENKRKMNLSLKKGLGGMILFQSAWTVGLILNDQTLIKIMGYQHVNVTILDTLLIAVYFQMILMILNIYLLYFELRKEAYYSTLIFLLMNLFLTLMFQQNTSIPPGTSYMLSSLLPVSYCFYQLFRKAAIIDYLIFNKTS